MDQEIKKIEQGASSEINKASSLEEVEALRVKYLGRKAVIHQSFSRMGDLSRDERVSFGRDLNIIKKNISDWLEEKARLFKKEEEKIDMTFPAAKISFGRKHVLNMVSERICEIFQALGFSVVEGKEVEDEWHNFGALNIPLEHPSREAFDTFYLDIQEDNMEAKRKNKGKYLLRSHTSPSQIRVMENQPPPLAVISPGRVYRPDKVDASHSFMFHQIEGFCVDRDINFSHLKGVLLYFAKNFFSADVKLRFRPHFFPFTEPSAEVDISCMICAGSGCSVCSSSGWLEVLGCGMIHPRVLEHCRISAKKYRGFAFGMGVDRMAMLKYGINDIRLFYENDIRFLNQFYEI
ncbi:MAG: phenylalanine--tRNA ligase subunit alpha [Candidatus Omnitrophota bacterium]